MLVCLSIEIIINLDTEASELLRSRLREEGQKIVAESHEDWNNQGSGLQNSGRVHAS